jgi:hypothetical protein
LGASIARQHNEIQILRAHGRKDEDYESEKPIKTKKNRAENRQTSAKEDLEEVKARRGVCAPGSQAV